MRFLTILGAVLFLVSGVASAQDSTGDWKTLLRKRLPLYGHRNWIVVADSAYPAQSRPGIETVVSNAGQTEVLREVLARLAASKHVRPNVFVDRELRSVSESDAPGVDAYRRELENILPKTGTEELPHEQIIDRLDKAGETFRVLIIKTTMTIPYTSVFLQLDCAYWSSDAEKRLRTAIGSTR